MFYDWCLCLFGCCFCLLFAWLLLLSCWFDCVTWVSFGVFLIFDCCLIVMRVGWFWLWVITFGFEYFNFGFIVACFDLVF